eukprot:TRINITY_DN6693_c0_g1_i2.p1 TRINITY_DN6693_c0_g1~~TRINITY_DN6693_c0_g1_i2.p1  ORF type:complete len:570 (+),score=81.38 TRINITY_DN6693_c0_g1_i2:137-1846(+)
MGDADANADTVAVSNTFRSLVDSADRKFARVRDLPSYGGGGHQHHYLHKVFKAYTKLWKFQQENRQELVESGLKRWEIGEIASRIGQLYYGQYLRTSEARFLLESYVFYEAILNRGYFQCPAGAPKDLVLRYKELRFYARFLVVSMVLNRTEMVRILVDRFKALVDDSKVAFPARNLKLQDALLTSYRRNEVKFTELTLDTFRMLQCLEWEPSGTFYQMRTKESNSNGAFTDQSGLIDINLAADMTDPTLPPNPRKAILYHPSVTHLISVLALICEELPHDRIMLMYISASGKAGQNIACQKEISRALKNSSNLNTLSHTFRHHNSSLHKPLAHDKGDSADCCGSCLYLGSRGNEGSNNLYPGDIIPFTRKPLFLIIDSDCSHAFKVIHGEERGEKAALLLSHESPVFHSPSSADPMQNGSQFTFFLTAPLQAFCQLAGLSTLDMDINVYNKADNILSSAFSKWEVILFRSDCLDQVWAQVLSDPFLRRLILRFIFCRSVLSMFCPLGNENQYLPDCLPQLPDSVSPSAEAVQIKILRLAKTLGVSSHFQLTDTIRTDADESSLESEVI